MQASEGRADAGRAASQLGQGPGGYREVCELSVAIRDYIGITEKKMETTIVYYGIYGGYIEDYVWILEKKMETTI